MKKINKRRKSQKRSIRKSQKRSIKRRSKKRRSKKGKGDGDAKAGPPVIASAIMTNDERIELLERKVDLLSKLVIYKGPCSDVPRKKFNKNAFNIMKDLFPTETFNYYNYINKDGNTMTRKYNLDVLEDEHKPHKFTGKRDDDIPDLWS